ncbi:hypothetical protein B0T16DRAFT_387991 [Cercophora newfieldiana]|uniref:Ysc84 actin-binding domain-containing protein n=1 Tax=Cercophora newfieldiana TaxID=92897 RepID=A0AA39YHQ0_9PEZI|nr:hypothetical protein B0T16DRAFT_387991 [Cercophora newfieldiana]
MSPQIGDPYPQDDTPYDYAGLQSGRCANPPPLPARRPATPATNEHTFHQFTSKLGNGVAKMTNIIGMESPWPSTMDRECQKAARILSSFSRETDTEALKPVLNPRRESAPRRRHKAYMTIREEELRNAHGLVIFSLARTGLTLFSPTLGSGVVVARLPDGSWSPPAAIGISSINMFLAPLCLGLDLVEAVLVLPTPESVDSFKDQCRFSLGAGAGMSFGPFVVPRSAASELFYGKEGIKANDILSGRVPAKGPKGMWPEGARPLKDVLTTESGPCNWGKLPKLGGDMGGGC